MLTKAVGKERIKTLSPVEVATTLFMWLAQLSLEIILRVEQLDLIE